jgi:ABC-type glycerol-3-phosphate transport system substrate-binding protein
VYGLALRGFAGAGQNMYIYPSLLRSFGGTGFSGKVLVVNTPQAVKALEWYVNALSQYAPPAVRNWNWPDIADAFSQGTVACYIDAHSSAAVITNPDKVQGGGQGGLCALAQGARRQGRDLDLELGFPDQRGAQREGQARHLAVHQLGDGGRDAGAHVVEVRRAEPSARA